MIVTIAFSLIVLAAFAQQDAQFSMFMFNRLQLNPAYAGMNKMFCVTTLGRQQWLNLPGAPKTGLVSIDYGNILHGGVGLTVDQDQLGFQKVLKVKAAYSYHQRLNVGTLGIGIDAGMIQQSLSGNFIAPQDQTDPNIPWSGTSVTTYDISFGLYYHTKRLFMGLSSTHLPQNSVKSIGTSASSGKWDYAYIAARHYYLMAGYTFKPNPTWEVTPSVLAKSVIATTQVDANLMVKWNKTLFAAVGYRIGDAYVAMIGMEKKFSKQFSAKFGYSYDISSSDIRKYSSGSHEFMLGFCYKIVPDPSTTSHMNVRFL